MTSKLEILRDSKFGGRVAEDESANLARYFVETEQWRKIFHGDADIIFGPKGSGKSAIYQLILQKSSDLQKRKIVLAEGEESRGASVFQAVTTQPPTEEKKFINLWKIYLLYLIYNKIIEKNIQSSHIESIRTLLESSGLLNPGLTPAQCLKNALEWIDLDVFGVGIKFSEPSSGEREGGAFNINDFFDKANKALVENDISIWILFDRLDVSFEDNIELEVNALRALFRVYVGFLTYTNIRLKVFLRDDIWDRITAQGFRETSHITRTALLKWEPNQLLNLVTRRFIDNDKITEFYDINKSEVMASFDKQKEVFYYLCPEQVESGPKQPKTFEWVLGRTKDSRSSLPRELINFFSELRETQLKLFENGQNGTVGTNLFERAAFKQAMPEVSRVKLVTMLYAEYNHLKPYIERLRKNKSSYSLASLAQIWSLTIEQASPIASELSRVGFFEERGTDYWVPFIFRPYLELTLGSA